MRKVSALGPRDQAMAAAPRLGASRLALRTVVSVMCGSLLRTRVDSDALERAGAEGKLLSWIDAFDIAQPTSPGRTRRELPCGLSDVLRRDQNQRRRPGLKPRA